jgi:hypothetical protein
MMKQLDEGLPEALRPAARLLRDVAPPSDLWRQRLLREIEAASPPRVGRVPFADSQARWSVRPIAAIAAGLLCVLIGAGSVAIVQRDSATPLAARTALNTPPPRVRFTLLAPNASHVSIVGDFNGWNPSALPLRRSADGQTWEVEVTLAPGRYAYSFVVDGALARDPSAPQARDDDFGSVNSVVMVKGS